MTDKEIIKALGKISFGGHFCMKCKYKISKGDDRCGIKGCNISANAIDLIDRQKAEINELKIELKAMRGAANSYKAEVEWLKKIVEDYAKAEEEIERLQKLQKPTETSGFVVEDNRIVFYTNILNGYRHEYISINEIARELNGLLNAAYKNDDVLSHYKGKLKTAKTEAIKEFAERFETALDERVSEKIKERNPHWYIFKLILREKSCYYKGCKHLIMLQENQKQRGIKNKPMKFYDIKCETEGM